MIVFNNLMLNEAAKNLVDNSIDTTNVGIEQVFGPFLIAISRNPLLLKTLFTYAILGFALVEAIALFGLMMAFLRLFGTQLCYEARSLRERTRLAWPWLRCFFLRWTPWHETPFMTCRWNLGAVSYLRRYGAAVVGPQSTEDLTELARQVMYEATLKTFEEFFLEVVLYISAMVLILSGTIAFIVHSVMKRRSALSAASDPIVNGADLVGNATSISYGKVLSCKGGIAEVAGLHDVTPGEIVRFIDDKRNLSKDQQMGRTGFPVSAAGSKMGLILTTTVLDPRDIEALVPYANPWFDSMLKMVGEVVAQMTLGTVAVNLVTATIIALAGWLGFEFYKVLRYAAKRSISHRYISGCATLKPLGWKNLVLHPTRSTCRFIAGVLTGAFGTSLFLSPHYAQVLASYARNFWYDLMLGFPEETVGQMAPKPAYDTLVGCIMLIGTVLTVCLSLGFLQNLRLNSKRSSQKLEGVYALKCAVSKPLSWKDLVHYMPPKLDSSFITGVVTGAVGAGLLIGGDLPERVGRAASERALEDPRFNEHLAKAGKKVVEDEKEMIGQSIKDGAKEGVVAVADKATKALGDRCTIS